MNKKLRVVMLLAALACAANIAFSSQAAAFACGGSCDGPEQCPGSDCFCWIGVPMWCITQ